MMNVQRNLYHNSLKSAPAPLLRNLNNINQHKSNKPQQGGIKQKNNRLLKL